MSEIKIIPMEFKNQRIMTTKILAEQYGTEETNIQTNYTRNKNRFIEGKHYIKLEGQELKDFKNSLPTESMEPFKFAPKLILWTDKGAARHAKILDTDEAWEVYEELEDTYFKIKENKQLLSIDLQTQNQMLQLAQGMQMIGSVVQSVQNTVTNIQEYVKDSILVK